MCRTTAVGYPAAVGIAKGVVCPARYVEVAVPPGVEEGETFEIFVGEVPSLLSHGSPHNPPHNTTREGMVVRQRPCRRTARGTGGASR